MFILFKHCFFFFLQKAHLMLLLKNVVILQLPLKKAEFFMQQFCSVCFAYPETCPGTKAIRSHVYSKVLLANICGSSKCTFLWNAFSKRRTTPEDIVFYLECSNCDKMTTFLEQSLIEHHREGFYDNNQPIEGKDAMLLHFVSVRSLTVDSHLFQTLTCEEDREYFYRFMERTRKYRTSLVARKRNIAEWERCCEEAAGSILFYSIDHIVDPFLTEFPFLCRIDCRKIFRCSNYGKLVLIYGQLAKPSMQKDNAKPCEEDGAAKPCEEKRNHWCFAIPLVQDVKSTVADLQPHFREIVLYVNEWLKTQRSDYRSSLCDKIKIKMPSIEDLNLIVGYHSTCDITVPHFIPHD